MNLERYQPWSLFDLLQRDLGRYPERRFGAGDSETPVSDWAPAVDIIEEKDRFVLRADLPGVAADDIDINMEDGILTIAGERHTEKHENTEGVRRFERVSGRFYRRFTLPDSVDADNIQARSTNGILEVTIPKSPEVQPRRISVEVA